MVLVLVFPSHSLGFFVPTIIFLVRDYQDLQGLGAHRLHRLLRQDQICFAWQGQSLFLSAKICVLFNLSMCDCCRGIVLLQGNAAVAHARRKLVICE